MDDLQLVKLVLVDHKSELTNYAQDLHNICETWDVCC